MTMDLLTMAKKIGDRVEAESLKLGEPPYKLSQAPRDTSRHGFS